MRRLVRFRIAAELNEFYAYYAKRGGGIPALQRQYVKSIKALNDAAATEYQKRFGELVVHFQKYGRVKRGQPPRR